MVTNTSSATLPHAGGGAAVSSGTSLPAATGVDWQVEWASPVVATAMAVAGLVSSEQHGSRLSEEQIPSDSAYQGDLSELLIGSLHWLARRQLPGGGWSATGDNHPHLATTMLVRATFALTGMPVAYPTLAERMQAFIDLHGGIEGVRARYGHQSVAARVIAGTWSLADLIDWNRATSLPIETFVPDQDETRTLAWQVDREDLAPLLALGVASFKLYRPFNPLAGWRRGRALPGVIQYIQDAQEPSGSFADSVAATSLVIMSLAGAGMTGSHVVRRGVDYLFDTVSAEGNWPGNAVRQVSTSVVPVSGRIDHSATA